MLLFGEVGGVAEEGFEELEVGEGGGDAGEGFDAGDERGEEGVVAAAFGFGEDFADDAEVGVGEERGLGEDHLVVGGGVVGVGEEGGGRTDAADDGGPGGHVAEALGMAGADDGDDGHGAAEEGNVHQAEHPAQETMPEGEPSAVEARHPQAHRQFAEALPVEGRLADEVVGHEGDVDDVESPEGAGKIVEFDGEQGERETNGDEDAKVYRRGEYAFEQPGGGVVDGDVLSGLDGYVHLLEK